jgi:hypothetical protein
MLVNTQRDEVEEQLESWGMTFAFWKARRECEPSAENLLYRMAHAKTRGTGDGISLSAWAVEDAVRALQRESPIQAAVLRAFYCESGRRGYERFDTAKRLAGRRFSRRAFYLYREAGKDFVSRVLHTPHGV